MDEPVVSPPCSFVPSEAKSSKSKPSKSKPSKSKPSKPKKAKKPKPAKKPKTKAKQVKKRAARKTSAPKAQKNATKRSMKSDASAKKVAARKAKKAASTKPRSEKSVAKTRNVKAKHASNVAKQAKAEKRAARVTHGKGSAEHKAGKESHDKASDKLHSKYGDSKYAKKDRQKSKAKLERRKADADASGSVKAQQRAAKQEARVEKQRAAKQSKLASRQEPGSAEQKARSDKAASRREKADAASAKAAALSEKRSAAKRERREMDAKLDNAPHSERELKKAKRADAKAKERVAKTTAGTPEYDEATKARAATAAAKRDAKAKRNAQPEEYRAAAKAKRAEKAAKRDRDSEQAYDAKATSRAARVSASASTDGENERDLRSNSGGDEAMSSVDNRVDKSRTTIRNKKSSIFGNVNISLGSNNSRVAAPPSVRPIPVAVPFSQPLQQYPAQPVYQPPPPYGNPLAPDYRRAVGAPLYVTAPPPAYDTGVGMGSNVGYLVDVDVQGLDLPPNGQTYLKVQTAARTNAITVPSARGNASWPLRGISALRYVRGSPRQVFQLVVVDSETKNELAVFETTFEQLANAPLALQSVQGVRARLEITNYRRSEVVPLRQDQYSATRGMAQSGACGGEYSGECGMAHSGACGCAHGMCPSGACGTCLSGAHGMAQSGAKDKNIDVTTAMPIFGPYAGLGETALQLQVGAYELGGRLGFGVSRFNHAILVFYARMVNEGEAWWNGAYSDRVTRVPAVQGSSQKQILLSAGDQKRDSLGGWGPFFASSLAKTSSRNPEWFGRDSIEIPLYRLEDVFTYYKTTSKGAYDAAAAWWDMPIRIACYREAVNPRKIGGSVTVEREFIGDVETTFSELARSVNGTNTLANDVRLNSSPDKQTLVLPGEETPTASDEDLNLVGASLSDDLANEMPSSSHFEPSGKKPSGVVFRLKSSSESGGGLLRGITKKVGLGGGYLKVKSVSIVKELRSKAMVMMGEQAFISSAGGANRDPTLVDSRLDDSMPGRGSDSDESDRDDDYINDNNDATATSSVAAATAPLIRLPPTSTTPVSMTLDEFYDRSASLSATPDVEALVLRACGIMAAQSERFSVNAGSNDSTLYNRTLLWYGPLLANYRLRASTFEDGLYAITFKLASTMAELGVEAGYVPRALLALLIAASAGSQRDISQQDYNQRYTLAGSPAIHQFCVSFKQYAANVPPVYAASLALWLEIVNEQLANRTQFFHDLFTKAIPKLGSAVEPTTPLRSTRPALDQSPQVPLAPYPSPSLPVSPATMSTIASRRVLHLVPDQSPSVPRPPNSTPSSPPTRTEQRVVVGERQGARAARALPSTRVSALSNLSDIQNSPSSPPRDDNSPSFYAGVDDDNDGGQFYNATFDDAEYGQRAIGRIVAFANGEPTAATLYSTEPQLVFRQLYRRVSWPWHVNPRFTSADELASDTDTNKKAWANYITVRSLVNPNRNATPREMLEFVDIRRHPKAFLERAEFMARLTSVYAELTNDREFFWGRANFLYDYPLITDSREYVKTVENLLLEVLFPNTTSTISNAEQILYVPAPEAYNDLMSLLYQHVETPVPRFDLIFGGSVDSDASEAYVLPAKAYALLLRLYLAMHSSIDGVTFGSDAMFTVMRAAVAAIAIASVTNSMLEKAGLGPSLAIEPVVSSPAIVESSPAFVVFDDAAPLASSTPPTATTTTTAVPTSSFEPRVLFEPPPARAPVDDSSLINDEDEPSIDVSVAEPAPELSVIDEEASSDVSSGITSTLANVSLADVEVDQRSTNPLLSLLNVSYVRTEGDPELGDDDLSPHDHYAYAMASNDVRPLDWLNASLLTVPPSDYVSKGTNSQTIRGLGRMPELFLGLANIYMNTESPLMGPYQTFKAAHDRVVALDTTPSTRSVKEELADLVAAMREHIVREQSEWDVYERRRPDGTVTRYTLPAGSLARFLAVYKALPTAPQTYASTTIPILRAALVAIAIGGVPDWIYDKMVADVPISKSLLLYIGADDQAALFGKHVASFERYVKTFTRATVVSLINNAKDILAILRFRKHIGQNVVVDAKRIINIARDGRTSLSLTAAKATNIESYDQALKQSALITFCTLLVNG